MAKRLVTDPEDLGVESQLIRAIGDLAAGRLQAIIDGDGDLNYASTADRTGSGRAVDALLRRLHAGVIQLARELVTRPPEDPEAIAVSQAQTIFSEVKNLCIATLEGVFDADGPHAVSVFPGPLHLAKLLLAVSGDLAEAGIFVWHGNFYAQPVTEALNIEPDGAVRIGLLHYNTLEEVNRLIGVLQKLA